MMTEHTTDLESVSLTEAVAEGPTPICCPVGEAVFGSLRSPDKESCNEDALLLAAVGDGGLLLIVADGCGGMPAGHAASAAAVHALHERVVEMAPEPTVDSFTTAMLSGFDAANRAVLDQRTGSATTLLAACVVGGVARVMNVGDSMALVVGQRGRERFTTVAQSMTGYAVESGMLSEQEAIHHDDRNVVLNVVGDEAMRVVVGPPIELRKRDTLLLASDGLCDNLHMHEIIDGVRTGPLLGQMESLTALCRSRMAGDDPALPRHADDLTYVAYRCGGRPGG